MSGRLPRNVRIVGGAKRGHRLKVARGGATRPTGERVREAIFDALGPVDGLKVLDLFAGTGAMGLEALSRGAERCVFVEEDRGVTVVLRENIAALGYGSRSRVMLAGYERAARRLGQEEKGFDLLFVDPPYRMLAEVEVTLKPLLASLLAEDGVAVVEGGKSSQTTFGQTTVFDRIYGDTKVMMITMRRNIA
ncbi:MAG: 16S rRNA (guanine(966)-N(2))-methyltransferase RsmD [Actinobacteria bacterium]|jgi:16S rRNA (guanine(966)-N(2))-methyltransferase RsmD|nr:16S rRNA (guanine(966)-N(2))-methyltransferase RsmD [Actinomycetota bacterium]